MSGWFLNLPVVWMTVAVLYVIMTNAVGSADAPLRRSRRACFFCPRL